MIDINAYVRHDKAEHNKKNIFFSLKENVEEGNNQEENSGM